ncbi:MAG: universal stress protein [Deltaproteobacteria bacterium]|nr:universal stress protein [Deltaproteobacteria bacterium]
MTERLRIKRLLVPVDGSECSRYAAEHAVRIAAEYGAEIVFLHAVDEVVVSQLAQHDSDDGRALVRERLLAQGQTFTRDAARLAGGRVSCREEVAEGDPCALICESAAASDADLIIMGKAGRRGTRRILMGSVTRRVIESTDVPVLVVAHPPR